MWPILTKHKVLLCDNQFQLFNSLVRSVILYGAETWGLDFLSEIDSIQSFFVKKLLALPRNTPNFFIYLDFGIIPASALVISSAIKMWSRMVKPESLLRTCYLDMWHLNSDPKFSWSNKLYKCIGEFITPAL